MGFMATKINPLEKIKKKYHRRINTIVSSDKAFKHLLSEIKSAPHTQFGGIMRKESKKFDAEFISEVEHSLHPLERIVKNPRQFIREEYNVVPVELAKKTGSKAIQHLTQHSELVKEINAQGDVIPDKILGTFVEEELAIYENRFVMTLIRKLALFVEMRYRYIDEHGDTTDSDLLTIKAVVPIGGAKYEVETKMKLIVPSDDEGYRAANDDLLSRLKTLRQRVTFLVNSSFMRALRKANPVSGKISQTNMIRSNPDYRAAYQLWLFIGRYDALGVTYSIKERKVDFNNEYIHQLYALILSNYLTLKSDKAKLDDRKASKYQIFPRFVKPILDRDIADDRFLDKVSRKDISLRKMTDAQLLRQKKREIEKEKAKIRKEKEKERQKALVLERKERAAKRALEKKEHEKELARLAKEAKLEKQRLALEELKKKKKLEAERKAIKAAAAKRYAEEQARLKEARLKVKKVAVSGKEKKEQKK